MDRASYQEEVVNQCVFCGGELTERETTFVREDDGQVWIIRHVPAYVCRQCGEKEYIQDTTHRLLSLLRQPSRPTDILHVPAYDLTPA